MWLIIWAFNNITPFIIRLSESPNKKYYRETGRFNFCRYDQNEMHFLSPTK